MEPSLQLLNECLLTLTITKPPQRKKYIIKNEHIFY